jgi:hypothetical protein
LLETLMPLCYGGQSKCICPVHRFKFGGDRTRKWVLECEETCHCLLPRECSSRMNRRSFLRKPRWSWCNSANRKIKKTNQREETLRCNKIIEANEYLSSDEIRPRIWIFRPPYHLLVIPLNSMERLIVSSSQWHPLSKCMDVYL